MPPTLLSFDANGAFVTRLKISLITKWAVRLSLQVDLFAIKKG